MPVTKSNLKRCTACLREFELSNFRKNQSRCKECHSAATLKWQRDNPERYRAKNRRWHEANPGKSRLYSKAQWDLMSREERQAKSLKGRRRHLLTKYGLTEDQFDAMNKAQNGLCMLCKHPQRDKRHRFLCVDHDHETGRVRGLLCNACNVSIAALGDTIDKMERVMRYMKGEVVDP